MENSTEATLSDLQRTAIQIEIDRELTQAVHQEWAMRETFKRGHISYSLPEVSFTSEPTMPTIAEQLKAARAEIAEARAKAATVAVETAEATKVVRAEVDKALKEAADLRAEVAELTNGGPA